MNATPSQLKTAITNAKNILVVAHQRPDGDTLGSALAMSLYLSDIDKKHVVFCKDRIPPYFGFLPRVTSITHYIDAITIKQFDLVIIVDHGSLALSGVEEVLRPALTTTVSISIDHHATNEQFATYNYVKENASSTCEVVTNLLIDLGASFSQPLATCLMTGLLTDTGIFTNSATDLNALSTAQTLVTHGAKIAEITAHVVQNKSLKALNLWGRLFERITVNPTYRLAYTVLLEEDLAELQLHKNAIDGFVNYLTQMQDVDVVLFLQQEKNNQIKGSFRTTKDDIDVAALAQIWGGGGHTKAAGFTIQGALEHTDGVWRVISTHTTSPLSSPLTA